MWALGLFVFLFVVWCLALISEMFGKFARGETGGTSFFPVIPCFPVSCWLFAVINDWGKVGVGTWMVIGIHILLLLWIMFCVVRSIIHIRTRNREAGANKDSPSK